MSDEPPIVYLVLGAVGSGRRDVVQDLIAGGLGEDERSVVFGAESEVTATETVWRWDDDGEMSAAWPADAGVGFFILDGRANPVDQIEAFKAWLQRTGVELARVICVVHCRMLEQHPPLLHWYDACIHFSDIALLNRREDVANKWLSEYMVRFAKRHIPCLVDMVKKGRIKNPALVLDLQTRRLSHWFDAEADADWKSFVTDAETLIIDEAEGDDAEDEVDGDEDEYLARHLSGARKKVLPNIEDYLPTR